MRLTELELVCALRTGEVPPGGEHDLARFLSETDTAVLTDYVVGGVATYAQFAALADQLLPEGHDTRAWLDDRLGRGLAARADPLAALALALPALDHAFPRLGHAAKPDWAVGGGAALALQLGHRTSRSLEICIHCDDNGGLRAFVPGRNPHAAEIAGTFLWSGHRLRFDRREGEVAFLWAGMLTHPGFEWRTVGGRLVAVETPEEVVVKAIRYRSERLSARDAFDLAAVGAARPGLAAVLAAELPDALPRLAESLRVLEARGEAALRLEVVPVGIGVDLLPYAYDRARQVVGEAADLVDAVASGRTRPPTRTSRR